MPSKPIFISHATADKVLADKLVILIETGIGIPDSEIFCTSLEGMGIPSGANFIDFIKAQIQEPRAVLLLLTPNYYVSEFCLCELGAAWSRAHRAFPLLQPPLTFNDVKGVLLGTQVLRLNIKEDLNQFQAEMVELFEMKGKAFAIWEKRRDEFLVWLAEYLKTFKSPDKVDPAKYRELEKNYEEAKHALGESEDRNSYLEETIEKLKLLKDKSEVEALLESEVGDVEKFNLLVKAAADAIANLPSNVRAALFHHFRGEELEWPPFGYSDSEEKSRAIKESMEDEFLIEGNQGVVVNDDDPLVQKALRTLDELKSFIDHPSDEFAEYYAGKYDHQLSFTNKRFWVEHL